jgi:metallo-beta-lactamase class B
MIRTLFCAILLAAALAAAPNPPDWSQPQAPFHIVGPVWYVGTKGIGVYAIVDKAGTILVSGPLQQDAAQIEANLKTIGVAPKQVVWILNSHAHFDHAGAFAELRRWSGAKLLASARDEPALRLGRHEADNVNGRTHFPPVPVDRIVHDGELLRLGGIAITAVMTPGHTPGCTTWTLPVQEGRRTLRVVFPCSLTVAGNVLVDNKAYPAIASDYRASFARLDTMPEDVVLPMHPEIADVLARKARRDAGDADAFIDQAALRHIVTDARRDFYKVLQHTVRPSYVAPQPQEQSDPIKPPVTHF